MELKLFSEYEKDAKGYSSKTYVSNETIQQNNFCDLLSSFENDTTCIYDCICNTYNENGSPVSPTFSDIDKMRDYEFENPAVSFMANFIDRESQKYRFSIISSINSNRIRVEYNPIMVSTIARSVARDKMFEDLKKNRENEEQKSTGGFTK